MLVKKKDSIKILHKTIYSYLWSDVDENIERIDRKLREAGARKGASTIKSFQSKTLGAISLFHLRDKSFWCPETKYQNIYLFRDL